MNLKMKPLSESRLYAFVDTAFLHGRAPGTIAQQLCDGGADLIQLRAKQAPLAEVKKLAQAILPVTRAAGVGLVINDHLELAQELEADFCHLGQEDFFGITPGQRGEMPRAKPQMRFGLSTHSPEDATRAVAAGADYLGVGPVFATGTKPDAKPVTLDYVRWASANVKLPWFAIGGINLTNLDTVLSAGARGICVVSAILNAQDVTAACREFRKRLA
jgi:thiamine-phosphate pyrophosphorylase